MDIRTNYFFKSVVAIKFAWLFNLIYFCLKKSPNVVKKIYYEAHLWDELERVLKHNLLRFKFKKELPPKFGFALSERIIEFPWFLSQLSSSSGRHFDAGSTLNFPLILSHPKMKHKKIVIGNLNPERNCFWTDSVSYIFADLRKKIFIDNYFDSISCLSVLEHVGLDNRRYSSYKQFHQSQDKDYLEMVAEFRRILKTGGFCYISVPFGQYQNLNWLQNFNQAMVDKIIAQFNPHHFEITYYRYGENGWQLSTSKECQKNTYANSGSYPKNGFCVGASAVALIVLEK